MYIFNVLWEGLSIEHSNFINFILVLFCGRLQFSSVTTNFPRGSHRIFTLASGEAKNIYVYDFSYKNTLHRKMKIEFIYLMVWNQSAKLF